LKSVHQKISIFSHIYNISSVECTTKTSSDSRNLNKNSLDSNNCVPMNTLLLTSVMLPSTLSVSTRIDFMLIVSSTLVFTTSLVIANMEWTVTSNTISKDKSQDQNQIRIHAKNFILKIIVQWEVNASSLMTWVFILVITTLLVNVALLMMNADTLTKTRSSYLSFVSLISWRAAIKINNNVQTPTLPIMPQNIYLMMVPFDSVWQPKLSTFFTWKNLKFL